MKTTESSTRTIQHDVNIELTYKDKKEVEKISINIKVVAQVTSVDLKSFSSRLFCSNRNEDITWEEEFVNIKSLILCHLHQTVKDIKAKLTMKKCRSR